MPLHVDKGCCSNGPGGGSMRWVEDVGVPMFGVIMDDLEVGG